MARREYKTLDIAAWEEGVGSPAEKWKGRCHEIAILGIKAGLVKGFPAYGHYHGDIAVGSFFGYNRSGICRHGWVRTKGGLVIDPTRWVFQNVEPYIFLAELDKHPEYDEGGNQTRAMMRQPCPPLKSSFGRNWDKVVEPELSPALRDRLYGLTGDADGFTQARMYWLANHSPEEVGLDLVKEFYRALKALGYETAVPVDNLRRVAAMRSTKKPGVRL